MPRTVHALHVLLQNGCLEQIKQTKREKDKTIRKTSERAHMSCCIWIWMNVYYLAQSSSSLRMCTYIYMYIIVEPEIEKLRNYLGNHQL